MSIEKINAMQAEVRLRNQRVGQLFRREKSYIFKYDDKYINQKGSIAISLKIPLRTQEFVSNQLHSFFDNLIMEGWLLNQAEKKLQIDKKNRWGLLMLVGANPIGAVSVHALDNNGNLFDEDILQEEQESNNLFPVQIPRAKGICSFCLKPVDSVEGYHVTCYRKLWGTSRALSAFLNKDNPVQTFSQTIYDGSISGAQRKGLFSLEKNKLVVNSKDSMYILKPDGDYPELPANEHVTMAVASILKFEVPPIGIIEIDKVGLVLVIKRFDRGRAKEKLLVEDMAQIYEEASEDKYSLSHEKVGEAIQQYTQAGPLNLQDFFRRVIFCYLTANGDMHLKNWSLLEMDKLRGFYKLCPVYDWLNTRIALSTEKNDLAISLRGKQRNMQRSYFYKFGIEDLKLKKEFVTSVFSEIPFWKATFERVLPHSFLSEEMKEKYLKLLAERSALLQEE